MAGTSGTSSGRRQSAILIPVPEAEEVVGAYRAEHDPVAMTGVPAHITLIVPWLPPDEISDADLKELADALRDTHPFDFTLHGVGWFGRRVLWMRPRPTAPFKRLTSLLADRFSTPPWDDEFDEVIPHLTIGHHSDGVELGPVAAALEKVPPIHCRADQVWVMIGDGERWSVAAKLDLPEQPTPEQPASKQPAPRRPASHQPRS